MRRIVLSLVVVALCTLPFAKAQSQYQTKPLVFTHVTVIDATGASPRPDMTVMTTGNRITVIGKTAAVTIPRSAQVINGTGKFLIPGLWDMHAHWYGPDHTYRPYLGLFVANGVTGVRVMWGAPLHFEWRKEIQEELLLGPRMVISSTIIDGPKPAWPASLGVGNATEGRQAVTKVRKEGADFVKVYSLLPREAYFAIADEAKKQGLPFAGHVPFSVSVAEASDAGQRSIEHLTGVLAECSPKEQTWRKGVLEAFSNLPEGQTVASPARTRPLTRMILEDFSAEKAKALFAHLKRNQTWQCPTITFWRSSAFLNDPSFRDDPRLRYVPTQLRAQWDPTTDYRYKERTEEDYELAKVWLKKLVELVGMMHRAGVPFLAGTDVGNPYCFPGFSMHDELALLVQAGLSPMEALQTATRNPANYLGNEKELGTVEEGKIADLVLLEANPLEDIRNTAKINSVVLNGRLLGRKALDQLLAELETKSKE